MKQYALAETLDDKAQQFVDHQYSYEKIRDDLCRQFKTKFHKDIFKRHFDDYVGKRHPIKKYILVEVLGMLVFFIISLLITALIIYARLNISPFNSMTILKIIMSVSGIIGIVFTIIILFLALFNAFRIMKHPNIFGILYGHRLSNYLIHPLQYTYVLDRHQSVIPIYFTLNINELDFSHMTFDNHDIIDKKHVNDIMEQQYDNNESFIVFLHEALIEAQRREFNQQTQHLNAFNILKKSRKWEE